VRIALVSLEHHPLDHASAIGSVGGQVLGLASELVRRGHTVTVYTRRRGPTPEGHRPGTGVVVVELEAGPHTTLTAAEAWAHRGALVRALRDAWRTDPPHAVHSTGWLSGALAIESSPGGTCHVHAFHGLAAVERRHLGPAAGGPPERLAVEQFVARRASAVLASCVDEQRELLALGTPRGRIHLVPGGVDPTRFRSGGGLKDRSGPPRVVTLGRLLPCKGVDDTIQAMRQVPCAELLVIGGPPPERLADDPDVTRLRMVARRHLVDDRVRFHGGVPHTEVPNLLRGADVLVATPWFARSGTAAIEAMACGVPVVAAMVGGMLETVEHGRTGLLVPARDPGATAAAVRSLLDEPVARRRIGSSASSHAHERFGWPSLADRLLPLYRSNDRSNDTFAAATP
jgi:D-inositol-3-phosphate glycosyltransferase